jgi:hypothetical protein
MMWRNEAFRFFREFDYSEVAMRCVRIFPTPDRETSHREVRHFDRWFYVGGGYAWKRFTSSQPKEEQRWLSYGTSLARDLPYALPFCRAVASSTSINEAAVINVDIAAMVGSISSRSAVNMRLVSG